MRLLLRNKSSMAVLVVRRPAGRSVGSLFGWLVRLFVSSFECVCVRAFVRQYADWFDRLLVASIVFGVKKGDKIKIK